MATMTRQHFQLIADAIDEMFMGNTHWNRNLEQVAHKFADKLAETNPNFNRDRFLTAAGVTE